MDRARIKPYHKRKVQKMTPIHKENRVKFARWALRHYGNSLGAGSVWRRLINSDFSEFVKVNQGDLNTKNDVIWSHSIEEAGDLLDHKQEQYPVKLMILEQFCMWSAPVFVDQLLDQ